ncbi:MAG: hypothetical protein COB29_01235 [Sulfitobacter sp.]|nr:MAG: hypothetical protein COB29_01235 [Sulfitobacter sp.]
MMTHTNVAIRALIGTKSFDEVTKRIFVDSCTEDSLSNDLNSLTDVVGLDPITAPVVEGAVDGPPTRATHRGKRTNLFGEDMQYTEEVLYSPKFTFNLSSTKVIAKAGFSTLHDSDDKDQRLFLVANKKSKYCGQKVVCEPVGGIWVLPESTKTATASTTTENISTSLTATSKSREEYGLFRRMLGAVSHVETMRVAKQMGIELRNVKEEEVNLDFIGRIANQASRPSKSLDRNVNDPHGASIHIGSDTVGNHLPTSAEGNQVLQTFSIWPKDGKSRGYRVYVGPDKTAEATWLRFKKFCTDEGLSVAHEAVSQPIVFHSDNGGEYMGKGFAAPRVKAGIKHVTSTVYRSDGRLELPNHLNQQRMRANLGIGHNNFVKFGFDERHYWDYAAKFGALQDSTRAAALHGELTLAQVSRELGAHFGAVGTVTLAPESSLVKDTNKQIRNRSTKGLYLGRRDNKYSMLLNNGKVHDTVDVVFDKKTCTPPSNVMSEHYADIDAAYVGAQVAKPTQPDTPNAGVVSEVTGHTNTFVDGKGDTIMAGDQVSVVFSDPGNPEYAGTVVDIDENGGTFTVHYDDDDICIHDLTTDCESVTLLSLKASTVKKKYEVHHSIKRFLTPEGNVKREYLIGAREFPPTPPKPTYTRGNAPPDPETLAEAFASDEAIWWLEGVIKEYKGHAIPARKPPTFHDTTEPANMSSKWVLRKKFDGSRLEKFKARLVAAGYDRTRGVDYEESYVSGAPVSNLRDLEVMALCYNWFTYEADMVMAYTWVPRPKAPNGKEVILRPAQGTQTFDESNRPLNQQLDMALYGLPESGWALAVDIADKFLNKCPIKLKQCTSQPVLFAMEDERHPDDVFIINIYNDNIRTYTSNTNIQQLFRGWLATHYDITGGETPLRDQEPQAVLGMTLTYKPDSVKFSMEGFCQKALQAAGMSNANPSPTPMVTGFSLSRADIPDEDEQKIVMHKVNAGFKKTFSYFEQVTNFYRSLVSSLGWIAKQCAPILSLPVSILGRVMHCPPWKAFTAVKRVYAYINGRRDIGLKYVKKRDYDWRNGDFIEYVFECDASFADDDATRRSQSGYVGGPRDMAVTTYASNQIRKVTTSTKHAESAAAFPACKEIVYETHVQEFLKFKRPGPMTLYMDNSATVLDCGAPIRKFSPASKHFDIEDKYVVQCSEDKIVKVIHMPGTIDSDNNNPQPGDGFCVDALTKPMPQVLHDIYYAEMQG